ncbi:MAG: hypothetical protein EA379_00910 [Phycisphaerales bacterium]|nr:MAG: hypothetical protein EA379_00910 [Phycisphaerales bacterium]
MTSVLAEIDPTIIPIIAVTGGFAVAIVAIIFNVAKNIVVGRAHEQTRREVAAYVAEGTMSPDDAERILKAAPPKGKDWC